jgi:hypothetical protein
MRQAVHGSAEGRRGRLGSDRQLLEELSTDGGDLVRTAVRRSEGERHITLRRKDSLDKGGSDSIEEAYRSMMASRLRRRTPSRQWTRNRSTNRSAEEQLATLRMRQRGIAEQPSAAALSLNLHSGALVETILILLCLKISD